MTMLKIAEILIPCLASLLLTGGAIAIGARLLPPLPAAETSFAERVAREIENPDAELREALHEVDRIGYHAPPVAVAEPTPPTLIGGNNVWRAPLAILPQPPSPVAALTRGPALFDENRAVNPREWFWPYVDADLGAGMFLLRERFGRARVSREWLEDHQNNIVQAMRRL